MSRWRMRAGCGMVARDARRRVRVARHAVRAQERRRLHVSSSYGSPTGQF